MIILDDQNQHKVPISPVAGTTNRVVEDDARTSTSMTISLPDYETSQASLGKTKFVKTFFNIRRTDKRFWRAVAFAFIIYLLISLAIGIPFLVIALRRRNDDKTWSPPQLWATEDLSTPKNSMDFVDWGYITANVQCQWWNKSDIPGPGNLLSANLQYGIPVDGQISLRSNYSQTTGSTRESFGSLTIELNPNNTETQGVIMLTMQYSNPLIRENTNVCLMNTNEYAGFDIYIPNKLDDSDTLTFNIILLLPHTPSLDGLRLVTYLSFFTQELGDLGSSISFGNIILEGFSSKVTVGSLRGESISVITTMAEIDGTFEASKSLTLDTMSASINANITLVKDSISSPPTCLQISTGNSGINVDVTLVADPPTGNPKFILSANTFNGPLNMTVMHAPSSPPAMYGLRALNSVGPINVTVDSKFEGSFEVQTKFDFVSVGDGGDPRDLINPYGTNQSRQLGYNSTTPTDVTGWVGWQPSTPSGKPISHWPWLSYGGFLLIESSLRPVNLQLSLWGEGKPN